jgi:pyridoxal phosphate enzyme (YggS family)
VAEFIDDPRRRELARGLASVRQRVIDACVTAGRDPAEVSLVVVTKTYPAADVVRLASLGVADIGENRDQEAAAKAAEVTDAGVRVRWHFVGQLQRNKCRSVVRYADLVHTVDSVRLAEALGAAAQARERALDVLVQASLDGDPDRGGARGDGLDRVAAAVAGQPALVLKGLMAVAPIQWPPARAFARLADLAARVRRDHPNATVLSAGMSGDFESAIHHGATHVRVGSAVLGNRAVLL